MVILLFQDVFQTDLVIITTMITVLNLHVLLMILKNAHFYLYGRIIKVMVSVLLILLAANVMENVTTILSVKVL